MAASDLQQVADPEAVKRHPTLFRAIRQRKNPRLRRTDITVTDDRAVQRAVKAAALGNAMEWFDFGIYSYLAVTLGHVFFPVRQRHHPAALLLRARSRSPSWCARSAASSSAPSATGSAARRSSPSR